MGREEKVPPCGERRVLMSGGKDWEVSLHSDFTDYQVWCKNFRSLRRARRFMTKVLRKNAAFYCATISNEAKSFFKTFYWNGQDIIYWNKPWVLSRRQASALTAEDTEAENS